MSTEPAIGVSCGHVVPRIPVREGRRKLYWCEQCDGHKMSGGPATGTSGFDFLLLLKDEVSARGVAVTLPANAAAHQIAVVRALGAEVSLTGR